MSWYEDPNGLAQKITAAVGALITLITTLPDVFQGTVDASTLTAPIGVIVSTVVALWAIRAARKRAFAPKTVVEMLAPAPDVEPPTGMILGTADGKALPEAGAVVALRREAAQTKYL